MIKLLLIYSYVCKYKQNIVNKSYLWCVNSDTYGENNTYRQSERPDSGGWRHARRIHLRRVGQFHGPGHPLSLYDWCAGACNGLSYMSGQRGRARYSNIDLLEKYNYIGLKYLLKKRNIMDFDLLFREFPEHILPYDYDAYFSCPERFVMVTTNCLTGEADYFEEKKNKERVIDIVRASSSLPFVCPVTYVDNIPMLDGGIADSIPLMRARRDGYDRNVVVLTRNRGYRKDIQGTKVPSFIYKKYPRLREAINRRSSVYNEQLELVERLEDAGEITVIRPQKPIVVDRIERDISKLTDLYEEGYACAAAFSFSSDNIK